MTKYLAIIATGLFFCFELSAQTAATADATHSTKTDNRCAKGCVPFSEVLEIQGDGSITQARCNRGCIATDEVRRQRKGDANELATAPAPSRDRVKETMTQPKSDDRKPPDSAETPTTRPVDGRLSQMVLQPTALGQKKRQIAITGYGAGYWQLEAGVTDNFSITGATVLPVALAGGALKAKFHMPISNNIAVALSGMFLIGGPYIDGIEAFIVVEGAQLTLTGHTTDNKHLVNFSLGIGAMQFCEQDYDSGDYACDGFGGALIAPRMGYRAAVHRRMALQLEWLMPMMTEDGDLNGKIHFVSYGAQFHGDKMFSDLGFLLPIFKGAEEIYQILPIGIPYFTVGFKI